MLVLAWSKYWFPSGFVNWNSFIDNHIYPIKILVYSQHKETSRSVSMEDWRIDTVREKCCNLFINDHLWVIFHSSSTSYKELVSCSECRHGGDQPAVTKPTLTSIESWGTIVNELCLSISCNLLDEGPINLIWFSISFLWYSSIFVKGQLAASQVILILWSKIHVLI